MRLLGFAVIVLAAALGVFAYVFYKQSKEATTAVQNASASTSGINDLAAHADRLLKQLGV